MSEQQVIWCVDSSDHFFQSEQTGGRGVHLSPSFVKEMIATQPKNRSLYQANYRNLAQETTLERVRRTHYPNVASRLGALFAYPDRDTAEISKQHYWQGERDLYYASVCSGSRCLLTDSSWLSCSPEGYEAAAHRYFQGVLSEEPQLEMLIHGAIRVDGLAELDDAVKIDNLLASAVHYYPGHAEPAQLPMGPGQQIF